jgi:hypothetical protein
LAQFILTELPGEGMNKGTEKFKATLDMAWVLKKTCTFSTIQALSAHLSNLKRL